MKCDQCESLVINGVFTHEHGCPNRNKKFDPDTGVWITMVQCQGCGYDVPEGEPCCTA